MIKDDQYLKQSILIKDKYNKDNNKTLNFNKEDLNIPHNNNHFNNNIKKIYCKIMKSKTKMKFEFNTPKIPPSFIKRNKLISNINNYKVMNLTTIIDKANKIKDISFNDNKSNNKNKNQSSINVKRYNTIEEKYKRKKYKKNKKLCKLKDN